MNYKNTLLMPFTLFEMKGNLPKKEREIQKKWLENNIVEKIFEKNKNKKSFILHDGPPYANGDLHVGHALNKILKDFVVRYFNQKGYNCPFICGWDTHGLPIENSVSKLGINYKKISFSNFRNICNEYSLKQIENQKNQFQKLGLLTDFNKKYFTSMLDYELIQLDIFKKIVEKKLIYRDLKPVYWSFSSETALAEAEIEYKNLITPSVYVSFDIIYNNNINNFFPKNTKIIIWTTTPWTIPMNQLIAVGKNIIYCLIKFKENYFIISKKLLFNTLKDLGWDNYLIEKEFSGSFLINIYVKHSLYNWKKSMIIHSDHVNTDIGTGIVHIAPAFGEDDYNISKLYNIKLFSPIDDSGKYTKDINDSMLENIFYEKGNDIIINKLKENNNLLKLKYINHRHPIDWRTKKPVIYKATYQWFISINKIKNELVKEIKKVKWIPDWTFNKMKDMILNRDDWCISRQRLWGVPIIAFYDENSNYRIDIELINYVLDLFKKNKNINIWFDWDTDKLLPFKYRNKNWKKETNIMDVWFDSGVSNIVVNKIFNLGYPSDIYLEGNDQFRGWFNSSLICSYIFKNEIPYKKVISHGFVNDNYGKKMSKSAGNIINPLEIVEKYGSDILRLWVLSVDYNDDVNLGSEIINQIIESYKKIRNTFKFLLSNLNDFDFEKDLIINLSESDLFILYLTKKIKFKIIKYYEEFNFNSIFHIINNFIINKLSKFYFSFIKDILYIEKVNSYSRRSIQTTLFYILKILIDILKPILPHTTEEVYSHIKNIKNKKISVHLEEEFNFNLNFEEELIKKWEKILKLKNDINKEFEIQRNNKENNIKKILECEIFLNLKNDYKEIINIKNLYKFFSVSKINFVDYNINFNEYETSFIFIKKKDGLKCQRCWLIFDLLSKNNEICNNCFLIINNN